MGKIRQKPHDTSLSYALVEAMASSLGYRLTPLAARAPRPKSLNQDVGTPPLFLAAMPRMFGGPLALDLACSVVNQAAPLGYKHPDVDSLNPATPWPVFPMFRGLRPWLWLNCPYANIRPWAARCREAEAQGANILSLWLASVGSAWYQDLVADVARSYAIGRLQFLGEDGTNASDLMLSVFSREWVAENGGPGVISWRNWREVLLPEDYAHAQVLTERWNARHLPQQNEALALLGPQEEQLT